MHKLYETAGQRAAALPMKGLERDHWGPFLEFEAKPQDPPEATVGRDHPLKPQKPHPLSLHVKQMPLTCR